MASISVFFRIWAKNVVLQFELPETKWLEIKKLAQCDTLLMRLYTICYSYQIEHGIKANEKFTEDFPRIIEQLLDWLSDDDDIFTTIKELRNPQWLNKGPDEGLELQCGMMAVVVDIRRTWTYARFERLSSAEITGSGGTQQLR
jgi:hypothetical protein